MTVLDQALALAARGIPVFPCSDNKAPAERGGGGFHAASTDPDAIRAMFQRTRAPLIGVPTGAASGLDVLDLDPRHGSDAWWSANANRIPATLIHTTRSGGKHLILRHRDGMRSSAGKLAPGCDVRADGGYVVWWPAAGCEVWLDEPPEPWPVWLLADVLADRHTVSAELRDASRLAPPSAAAVVDLLTRLPNPADMGRDGYVRIMSAAGYCARVTGDDDGAIEDAAVAWAERWEGGEAVNEQAKWDSDWSKRDAPRAGWPTLQSEACRLIPGYRAEIAEADLSALPLPVVAPSPGLFYSDDPDTGAGRGYVIKHLIAPGDVCALLGQPGAGKSTLAPHVAYALSQGRPVFGLRTKPGRTLYAAAEDVSGFRQRLRALGQQHGHTRDCAGYECGNLREPAEQARLLAAVEAFKPALLILDTLGAAFAGLDENSAVDMGGVVAFARKVAATGTAVLLIHHPAKHGDGTPRGHSVLNGTLDMVLTLAPESDEADAVVRGVILKNRNGTTGRKIAFRRGVVQVGVDVDDEPITTTLPVELDAEEASSRRRRLPAVQAKALQALYDTLAGPNASKRGGQIQAPESAWRAVCDARALTASDNPDSQGRTFRRAAGDLVAAGIVVRLDGQVWLAEPVPGQADNPDIPGQIRTCPLSAPGQPGQPPLRVVQLSACPASTLNDLVDAPMAETVSVP